MEQHKNLFKLHFDPSWAGRRFQVSCKLKLLLEARNKARKRWVSPMGRGERRGCRSRFIVLTWNSTRYRTGNFRRKSQSLGNCESSVGADGRVVLILLPSSSVAVNKKEEGLMWWTFEVCRVNRQFLLEKLLLWERKRENRMDISVTTMDLKYSNIRYKYKIHDKFCFYIFYITRNGPMNS